MLENIHLNLTQSVNSLMRPMGLSLASKEQIMAKTTTMLALAAILVVGNDFLNLPLASANRAFGQCIQNCTQPDLRERGYCFRDCFSLLD